jgi:hypothetical protein
LVDVLEKRLQYAAENSSLPSKPDYNKVEEMVIEINKRNISK